MLLSPNCHTLGKLSMGYTTEQQADGLASAIAAGYSEAEINSWFTPIWSYVIGHNEERLREVASVDTTPGNPRLIMTGYLYEQAAGIDPFTGLYIPTIGEVGVSRTTFGLLQSVPAGTGTYYCWDQVTNNNRVDKVVYPRLLITPRKEVQGPASIHAFMADYNAAQAIGDRGMNNLLADARLNLQLLTAKGLASGPVNTYVSQGVDEVVRPDFGSYQMKNYLWLGGPGEGTIVEYTRCSIIAQQIITKVYGTRNPAFIFADTPGGWGPQYLDNVTQTDLIARTRCVMGLEFWEFQHTDGSTRRVPSFACPLPPPRTGGMPAGPTIIPFMPGDADMVCDYGPLLVNTLPPTDPNPFVAADPLGGYPAGGGGGGGGFGNMLLTKGKAEPIYPTYAGFLAFDMGLKKWGKAKVTYKTLLDLSPINTNQGKIVTTNRFGMEAAIYNPLGNIYRFDSAPADSYIKYGKIGMYRLGFTTLEEVRITFRMPVTGTIEVASSLDGRNPEAGLVKTANYASATSCIMGVGAAGKWHTIKISGNYDITHLEYSGYQQGRR